MWRRGGRDMHHTAVYTDDARAHVSRGMGILHATARGARTTLDGARARRVVAMSTGLITRVGGHPRAHSSSVRQRVEHRQTKLY